MKVLYVVMYTVNADWTGALYADGKVTLKGLTEAEIAESPRVKNRLDHVGLNVNDDPEQEGLSTTKFSAIMTGLVEQEPNKVMGVLSIAQGKWLEANHPLFKPQQTKEN